MHTLLLGNGLNRLSLQADWGELLQRLANRQGVPGDNSSMAETPFSLYFEHLYAATADANRGSKKYNSSEHQVKKQIAKLLDDVPSHKLHVKFVELFDVILTTNYDYTLECILGPFSEDGTLHPETRYSLFRRSLHGKKAIWHVHGELNRPNSLVLGYDHYVGYVQKIRNYVTAGITIANYPGSFRSPFKQGVTDFESHSKYFSWVDHFLRDTVHIVGLGLDFSEIDLWWLLLHKWRRGSSRSGKTYFYDLKSTDGRNNSRNSLLKSFGVTLDLVAAKNYEAGYRKIYEIIQKRVQIPEEPLIDLKVDPSPDYKDELTKRRRKDSVQVEMDFRSRKRRRRRKDQDSMRT